MAPLIHFIKPTFAGGEYAPSMYSRIDVARYSSGLKTARNVIIHPYGGASNRPGWHYVAKAKYANRKCRVHDFQFSSTQTYAIEIGHLYMRFYTNGGQIAVNTAPAWLTSTAYVVGNFVTQSGTIYYCIANHTSGTFTTDLAAGDWVGQTIYEIPSPYTESDLPSLNFTQSADVLFMFHPLYQTRQLNRLGATNWTITLYQFLYGPVQVGNSDITFTITPSGTSGSVTLTASSALFVTQQVGALFQINHVLAEQSVTDSLASVAAGTSILCGGTWRLITNGTWTGTIAVQKSTDSGSTWTNIRSFSSADDFNVNTFGTEDMSNNAPAFLVRLNMSSFSDGSCDYTLTADAFRNVGYAQITAFTDSEHVAATVTKLLGATTATFDWAEGSWSDYRGWPAVGEFNQDRLVTGNTANEPQTIWQTKASNYYDYSVSDPVVDSDSISTRLPARQLNGVNGFIPLIGLVALTSSSEWGIGTVGQVMSPLTITQSPYGFDGSSGLKPVIIKNRAIYVQFMGAVILDLGYELISNTFTGANLSILAHHLFDGFTITDMCYQQYPDSIVWALRDDGVLLSMTYLREQEVIAWAHHDTQGLVESCCSLPSNGYNQVWLSTLRGDTRYIEYMDHRMASMLPEDQFFVDCGVSYDGSQPDSFVKLYLPFDGINGSQIFTDGEIVPKVVTPNNNVFISTDESKFGTASGDFMGNAGLDSYTTLLLHMDGSQGSTTFTDSETTPKTVTPNGNTCISNGTSVFGGGSGYFNPGNDSFTKLMLHLDNNVTDSASSPNTMTNHSVTFSSSSYKFGGFSAQFNGTSSYLSTPDSAAWAFGTGDFTIDFWINPANSSTNGFLFSQYLGAANPFWFLGIINNTIEFVANNAAGAAVAQYVTTATLPGNIWTHVAIVRNGSNFYIFFNGVSQTLTVSIPIGTNDLGDSTFDLNIGGLAAGGQFWAGGLDEIRISKGAARWVSNFISPITPYSTGDYLSIADSADWAFGTGDFTIDFWINPTSINNTPLYQQAVDNNNRILLYMTSASSINFSADLSGTFIANYDFSFSTITLGTWNHVALVRNGTNVYLFINGISATPTVNTAISTSSMPDIAAALTIGYSSSFPSYFNGGLDEYRVSKGIARWTSNFTPPMAAYSMPGFLTLADSTDWAYGSGDFTIDFWVMFNQIGIPQYFYSQRADSSNFDSFFIDANNKLNWIHNNAGTFQANYITSSSLSGLTTGAWNHFALVRHGTTVLIFFNGVAQTLTVNNAVGTSTLSDIASLLYIGVRGDSTFNFDGFVDEYKIAKGVARWTSNFTPPIVPGFFLQSQVIAGLDYLDGQIVSILADGVVQPQQTVASGQISLAAPATKVHVGLPYTSDIETLNIEAPLPDGTMQGRQLKVSKCTIRVQNSKGGFIGPDVNTLTAFKSNFDQYQTSTGLFTGDLTHSLGGGYSNGGNMFIRQTDPLPITVLALAPLVTVGGTVVR